ncbi:MAG TPA: c-type cytochrome [Devosia sp.]|nr:c-type cytochrome [Devosia sp.]
MAAGSKPTDFRFLKRLGLLLVAEAVLGIAAAVAIVWFGLYDVAASRGHDPLTARFLHFVMLRSVAAHAPDIPVPNLDDPVLVLQGATHFYNSCGRCHGAPDQIALPIVQRMTPAPPPLYSAAATFTPQQLFWIVKNGIKMTAMPAWPAPQRDDEVWALVAFLEQLPKTKPAQFASLAGLSAGGQAGQPAATASPGFDPAPCARCHGADGNGRERAFPRIAGLSAGYIAASLRAFRSGNRPSGFMEVATENLSDAEIDAAAAYYAGLLPKPPAAAPPAGAVAQLGKALVEQGDPASGIAACRTCHLPQSQSRGAPVPDLTGQPAWYLAAQLRLLASGVRRPPGGTGSVSAAHRLSEAQLAAVSAYLASSP